ncbi:hypothetical protein CRENBAI_012696, partial [Crenichthys baileyi]
PDTSAPCSDSFSQPDTQRMELSEIKPLQSLLSLYLCPPAALQNCTTKTCSQPAETGLKVSGLKAKLGPARDAWLCPLKPPLGQHPAEVFIIICSSWVLSPEI